MDAVILYPDCARVALNPDFEALIEGQTPIHEKSGVPTSGTDLLHVATYRLHRWENALVRTNGNPTYSEVPAKESSPAYFFGKSHGMKMHLAGGLQPSGLLGPVNVELRVKTAEPMNRPEFDNETGEENVVRRSYEFILEISPGTNSVKSVNLFIERSGGDPKTVVLNAKRDLWVNQGVCVKAVPDGYEPPTKAQLKERAKERQHRQNDHFRHDRRRYSGEHEDQGGNTSWGESFGDLGRRRW